MERKDKYSLLLLAGGKSSRMGRNKAELCYGGKTFLDINIEKAKRLGIEHIYISGFQKHAGPAKIVLDQYENRGPLGGIHACLKESATPFCLVLPIDVPKLPQDLLEQLLEYHEKQFLENDKKPVLLWEHQERKEPLIGIYPAEMADTIESVICERSAAVFRVLDIWGFECFYQEMQEVHALDVNTPESYQELLQTK